MSLEKTISQEILELQAELSKLNDAVSYSSDIFAKCRASAAQNFEKANLSQSYDEKVEILAKAIQESLTLQESSLLALVASITSLKDKIEVLESVVEKNSLVEESKKKDSKPGGTEQGASLP